MNYEETIDGTFAAGPSTTWDVDQYVVPTDPMDAVQCESCQ